jgi:hypothetical protein
MRIVLIVVIAVAAAVFSTLESVAQQMPSATSVGAEEQRVLSAEDEYVAAEVARDEPGLRRLVDDKFAKNSPNGTTSGKEDRVNSLRYTSIYVRRDGQWRMLALQLQRRSQE